MFSWRPGQIKTLSDHVFKKNCFAQHHEALLFNIVDIQKWENRFSSFERRQFRRARLGDFFQIKPKLTNTFLTDIPLQSFLNLHVPQEARNELFKDLEVFGSRVVHEIDDLGWECELNLPSLHTQDAWGERVDELKTCSAWKRQKDICAQEGLASIPYEKKLGPWSRLHQACKIYLYAPSSGLYSCPLAMTDGAAKTIQTQMSSVPQEKKDNFLKAFQNLTTRNPDLFWTSGQWMTEKRGGSDVANATETVAVPENDFHRLYGYKWFSSASDSDMALTLARVTDNSENPQKTGDLTMFYLETKNSEGKLNNFQMVRLKDKLGTRQLPTAELLLDGCLAHKISQEGRGIPSISPMLTITRLHNSLSAVSQMRRILMLSRDYSLNRVAFGRLLSDTPLHMRILSKMETETRGSLLMLFKVALLLGKSESNTATADEILLLRILLPVLKLYTAKQAVSVISEGLETFGGQGYMEDSKLPVMYRDSQVLPIWEGTTNVMSLDLLRSMMKTNFDAFFSLEKCIVQCLEVGEQCNDLKASCAKVRNSIICVAQFVKLNPDQLDIAARDIAYSISRTFIGALLIENAALTKKETDIFTATQWCETQELCPVSCHQNYSTYRSNDFQTVMEGYREH